MALRPYPAGTVLMRPMLDDLARGWKFVLLRGLVAILFGVLTLAWPGLTLLTLVILYGAFALLDGGFSLAAAITGETTQSRWWLLIIGILGLVAGAVTLVWPGITGLVLLLLIAAWAITSGILQVAGAIRLRAEIDDEWLLIASGVLSVLFGVLILLFPGAGALGIAFGIGAYALIFGALLVAFSLRLRAHAHVRI